MVIAPFLRPANGIGDTPPIPYYLSVYFLKLGSETTLKSFVLNRYCLVGIAIMVFGIIYWAVWRIVLPKIFGYQLVPNKVILDDGTVVNVVRSLFIILSDVSDHPSVF